MIFNKKWIPGITWFFLVSVLICMPTETLPKAENWMNAIFLDKWIHAGLFGVLAFLFMFPVSYSAISTQRRLKVWGMIAVAVTLWGLITELIQQNFIKGRGFEWGDWLADSIGALIALLACNNSHFRTLLQKKLNKLNFRSPYLPNFKRA